MPTSSRWGWIVGIAFAIVITTRGADRAVSGEGPAGETLIAVCSAFPAELAAFREGRVVIESSRRINGVEFELGRYRGRPVVLFLTGIGITNAAMTTQLALDRFPISHVLFTGIAGGIDPALHPGDVVVADRWVHHDQGVYARETAPGRFQPPDALEVKHGAHFGMFMPRDVAVRRAGAEQPQRMDGFPVDQGLLEFARMGSAALRLVRADGEGARIVIGGTGLAAPIFADNAAWRTWAHAYWGAVCVDMESSAIAHVCWSNRVPVLVVRGLSDLAGGQEGENHIKALGPVAWTNAAVVLDAVLVSIVGSAPE